MRCIEIAAQTFGALGVMPTAILLTAAATQRRTMLGAPRPPIEEPEITRLLDDAHERLAGPAFEVAWTSGLDLPINVAVDLAVTELTTSLRTL